MPLACPRPCGRLATGAIFISVGVVQLTAAVILLKSKYVYLLSAPNIWTAISNIAVGGLLGLSAAVWKSTGKKSSEHAIRRNILAALVTSAILLNTTTAVLLIMGEGNTLLSIHLENNEIYSPVTFAREVLAYAYAASVCSPVLCVIVAIIFLSGMCFPNGKKSYDLKNVFESGSSTFNWVYKTERHGLPIPDPEILKKALSSKSFSSSDDSSSSMDFPFLPDSTLDLQTSKKRIYRIQNKHSNTFPQTMRAEYYSDATSRSGNRVSFVDNPVKERTIPKYVQDEDSIESYRPQIPKSKESGDPIVLISEASRNCHGASGNCHGASGNCHGASGNCHGASRNCHGVSRNCHDATRQVCQNEESRKLQDIDGIPNHLVASITVADASVISERDFPRQKQNTVSEDTEYSPPDVENFGKKLRMSEHKHLRRTSTTARLNQMLNQETSQNDVCLKSPTEYLNRPVIERAIFGDNSNSRNLNRDLHDHMDRMIDSRRDSLFGEVVPIRVNTIPPKKKLSSKLIPVATPVVSDIKIKRLNNRKESKFDGPRTESLSTFHVGHKMKNRLRSAESNPERYSEAFAVSTPKAPASEVPLEDTNLQPSPAHTSGYVSAFEDTGEPSGLCSSRVNAATDSNSSASDGTEISSSATARKKFREAQRKILDGCKSQSDTDAINDIVMQMISANPQLSSKESINELFYDILLQKIANQSTLDQN